MDKGLIGHGPRPSPHHSARCVLLNSRQAESPQLAHEIKWYWRGETRMRSPWVFRPSNRATRQLDTA